MFFFNKNKNNIQIQTRPWNSEAFKSDISVLLRKLDDAHKYQKKSLKKFLKNYDSYSDSDRVVRMTYILKHHGQVCEKYTKLLFDMCKRFVEAKCDCDKLNAVLLEDCAVNL